MEQRLAQVGFRQEYDIWWGGFMFMKADFKSDPHPQTGLSGAVLQADYADGPRFGLKQSGTTLQSEYFTGYSTVTATLSTTYTPSIWYTVEIRLTPSAMDLYVYKKGDPRPATPDRTESGATIYPARWHFWATNGTVSIDNVGRYLMTDPQATSYSYDAQDRLTKVANPDRSVVRYSYDSEGNRLTKTIDGTSATTYYYSAANELTRVVSPSGTTTYTYDPSGNTTARHDSAGTTSYSYDNFDQLVRIVKPTGDVVEYTYDADGNRYSKKVGGALTYYHYDADGNILSETDGAGAVKVRYVRDLDGKAVSMIQGARTYYFIYNGHGDVVALADETGAAVASYAYGEFGNTTSETGTVYNALRYAAAYNSYYDSETGFYKMGTRYYHSLIGRWTTRDQLDGLETNPNTYHKYMYVDNNPLSAVDPSGLTKKVVSPALPRKKQNKTSWCWAAVSQMMIIQHTDSNPTQAEIVNYVFNTKLEPNWTASDTQVAKGLNHWGVKTSRWPALTWKGLKAQINEDDPIYAHIKWPDGGAHAEGIKGYDTGDKGKSTVVIYNDPWDGLQYRASYTKFSTNNSGEGGTWWTSLIVRN